MSVGGAVRAGLIGVGLLALSLPLTGCPVEHPLIALLALSLAMVLFCALGVVVGVYARTWDHAGFVNNIVILPLAFLGGVFYSIHRLPSPWQEISHANPLFYLVNAVRYGFVGTSDVSVALSLAVVAVLAAVAAAWSSWLFATGRRLKA
jgi:ABC-2 type transport system permease protein